MERRRRLIVGAALLVPAVLITYIASGSGFDRRFDARPGGMLSADLELGSGLGFHRGSLEIASHEDDDVRVVAEISGWGKYAVDVDVRERADGVQVVGRVEGTLHWIFGGPTVDVRIYVPEEYGVDARIDGGPLVLEDLRGPVEARAAEGGRNTITLRRAVGVVKLAAPGGEIHVEDVEGPLKVENIDGPVWIDGVTGTTVVSAQQGGQLEIERVRGNVHAATQYGSIRLRDIEGDVNLETEDGGIEVVELDGRIRANTRHGEVDVRFAGAPAGVIETEGGSIEVEVPDEAAFDLDARTKSGSIELDSDLAFVRDETPDVSLGPLIERDLEAVGQLGLEIAAEVQQKVFERVQQELERSRRGTRGGGGEGERDWEEWDWSWSWDDPDWRWHDHEWALGQHDWSAGVGYGDGGQRVAGAVNGGGESLQLHSKGGAIKIRD
ncbi:MAG: DUF4097 family beta strand repeat-containing protein [Proteobacteria bacterium]|nr:DUF4097 family beta strand repeat-containing protein [Pseudomonadota bacterium]